MPPRATAINHSDLLDCRHRPQRPYREDGATIFRQACRMGLEGIVSKKLSAPYRSGPSRDWLKVKNPDSPAMIRARDAEW
jgi:ATP-dependent DNA ligase